MNKPPTNLPDPLELKLIIAGLGGQGVVFITRLLAQTAAELGLPVMASETHGMSQRGGSVLSHLKIGRSEAPLVRRGTADILLALEPDEAIRNLTFLRQGGAAVVNAENGLRSEVVEALSQRYIQLLCLPASRMAVALGSAAVANVMLAGFVVAHTSLSLPIEAVRATLATVASRNRELNLLALTRGYSTTLAENNLWQIELATEVKI